MQELEAAKWTWGQKCQRLTLDTPMLQFRLTDALDDILAVFMDELLSQ